MKNSKSIIAIIVLAILATIVTVVSCKKEKQEQKSYNAEQSVQCSDNMDEYLISFKNKLLSAQKGEETISLEQAQRDLGNLLNFDFGDANYPTNMYQVDSIHAKLTLTQGKVDLSQLAITYKETFDTILQTYHSIDLPEKSISSISCTFCENENKTNEEETVEVEIVVVTTVGKAMDLVGKNKIRNQIRKRATKMNYHPDYEHSTENILMNWLHLLIFVAAFSLLAVVTLEFVDKDKR